MNRDQFSTYPETTFNRSGQASVSSESLTKTSQDVRCDSLKTLSDRCRRGLVVLALFSMLAWRVFVRLKVDNTTLLDAIPSGRVEMYVSKEQDDFKYCL